MSAPPELPEFVTRAFDASRRAGYASFCRNETGRLLAALAATRTGTLAEFGTGALHRAIEVLELDPQAGEEQLGEATYAHKLSREDGRLNLTLPASAVLAHWAGVTPEPGAFVLFDEQPLKLHELRACGDEVSFEEDRAAGTVRLVSGRAILELTDASLELVRVQPAGKAAMAGADWLRGRGGEAVLS